MLLCQPGGVLLPLPLCLGVDPSTGCPPERRHEDDDDPDASTDFSPLRLADCVRDDTADNLFAFCAYRIFC